MRVQIPVTPQHIMNAIALNTSRKALGTPVRSNTWSPRGHIQPHRNHLPRRRNVKRVVLYEACTPTPEQPPHVSPFRPEETLRLEETALSKMPLLAPEIEALYQPHIDERAARLSMIVEGLWVAFSEDTEEYPIIDADGAPNSHVVAISYGDGEGSCEQTTLGETQLLRLVLPAAARTQTEEGRAGLALTDTQLRVARDFLTQALPAEESAKDSTKRVLLATPFGRPTDAMCVAAIYLAVVCKEPTNKTLEYVEQDRDVHGAFKGEITEDEYERIEKIATAWSWLSQVPQHPLPDTTYTSEPTS